MKRIVFLLILAIFGITIMMISCKKNNALLKEADTFSRDQKVSNLLINFKKNLENKYVGILSIDSATWYIEGLLNFEKAYNTHKYNELYFFKDSIQLLSNSGTLTQEQIDQAYLYFSEKINEILVQQNDPEFAIDLIDIYIQDNPLKDGEIEMIMEGGGGFYTYYPYTPFGTEDYWFWGFGLGKCGGYSGFTGIDAAAKLQYKFNHPLDFVVGDYYTDVEIHIAEFNDYEDPNNPFGDYMIFKKSGNGNNPPEEPCMSPDELNYYLSKFEYIKNDQQPEGKSFMKVLVGEDPGYGTGYWLRAHYYEIFYGIETVNPN